MKGGSLVLSWGSYGGFYIMFKFAKRICLGWIAFTYIPIDFDYLLDKAAKQISTETVNQLNVTE